MSCVKLDVRNNIGIDLRINRTCKNDKTLKCNLKVLYVENHPIVTPPFPSPDHNLDCKYNPLLFEMWVLKLVSQH